MRLFVMVQGYEIVVTSETGFRAEYWKRPNHPQLKVRRCTETDNYELLAQAWQLANAKARELSSRASALAVSNLANFTDWKKRQTRVRRG